MKKEFVILVTILLVFSAGCTTMMKKDEEGKTSEKFQYTGTDGLVVKFNEDKPPQINYREDEIEIVLDLVNKGMKELAAGEVQARLIGTVAETEYNPSPGEGGNEDELPSIKRGTASKSSIDLGTIMYDPDEMWEPQVERKIEVEVCYPYETVATTDSFWISDEQDVLAKTKITSKDNSAGPIKLHSLKAYRSKNKIRFEFIVENEGSGKAVESCWPEDRDKEVVQIEMSQPSDATCDIEGSEVKLINGQRKVTCELPSTKERSFQKQFTVVLKYNYDEELEETITIKNTELLVEPQ